jgi:hypothetical protein
LEQTVSTIFFPFKEKISIEAPSSQAKALNLLFSGKKDTAASAKAYFFPASLFPIN